MRSISLPYIAFGYAIVFREDFGPNAVADPSATVRKLWHRNLVFATKPAFNGLKMHYIADDTNPDQ